jgi:cellobiose epimerase
MTSTSEISHAMLSVLERMLQHWYPLVIDNEQGGYFTNVTFDWKLTSEQEKMIVTQARHVWALSKVASFFDKRNYEEMALHGFSFLKEIMWDQLFGGFYQIRNRQGEMSDVRGWRDEKRAYGNAFAVYALAALYRRTKNPEVLQFAQEAFQWIEEHCYDPKEKGYFQFIDRNGNIFDTTSEYKTIAADRNELGFKDQNASIHLLEAYTELFHVWEDDKVRKQLFGLLELIRDVEVTEKGYLQLFFTPDWKPVSFRNAPEDERKENYGLDHVSFGHDYETAFLMLEASYALGIENDTKTLSVAKKMLDHALQYGFDKSVGGFYDGGYYFAGEDHCTIIKDTKNWWAQAEGLNALLLFAHIFPEEKKYFDYFLKQWEYVKRYILDNENGDWFEGGLDKEPHLKTGLKSHIWKCTYHTARALMNCITILNDDPSHLKIDMQKKEMNEFLAHWQTTARKISQK